MACAACVEWDLTTSVVRVLSSIVGLPPIFILRMPGVVAVASDLALFRAVVRAEVAISPRAVVELFTVGHPLEHRTLFRDVTLMPGGHSSGLTVLGLPP